MKLFAFSSTQLQPNLTIWLKARLSEIQNVVSKNEKPLVLKDWSVVGHIMENNPFLTVTFLFEDWEECPLSLIVPFTGSKVLSISSDSEKQIGIRNEIKEELIDFAYFLVDKIEGSDNLLQKLIAASKQIPHFSDEEADKLFKTAKGNEIFMEEIHKFHEE